MNAIIAFALRLRALMVALFVLVMIGGVTAFVRLNIEAYPDPVPPLVDIVTQNPGQSAEEIERYITIPIEVDVAVAPYLTAMRTISLFGLSDVKLQFTYDLTYEEAEQKVLNRLSQLPALQNQAQPTISPWSPIGEIYRYQLVGPPGYSVMELPVKTRANGWSASSVWVTSALRHPVISCPNASRAFRLITEHV